MSISGIINPVCDCRCFLFVYCPFITYVSAGVHVAKYKLIEVGKPYMLVPLL